MSKYITIILLSLILVGCNQQAQPLIPNSIPQKVPVQTIENMLLDAHNKERFKENLSALSISKELTVAAAKHCKWMASNNKLSHKESFRSTMESRIKAEKYNFSSCGENIAEGQPDVNAVMKAWMSSSGHRRNIMDKNFSEIGIGVVNEGGKIWWCVDFARPQSDNKRPFFPIFPRGENDNDEKDLIE